MVQPIDCLHNLFLVSALIVLWQIISLFASLAIAYIYLQVKRVAEV